MDNVIIFENKKKYQREIISEKVAPVNFIDEKADPYIKMALEMMSQKKYFEVIKYINKANEIGVRKSYKGADSTLLALAMQALQNYEQAEKYAFRCYLDIPNVKTPIGMILVQLLKLTHREYASLDILDDMINQHYITPEEYEILVNNLIQEPKLDEQGHFFNLKWLKKNIIKAINEKDFELASSLLARAFELDETDPYISYLYYNLDEAFSRKISTKLPDFAILQRMNYIMTSLKDEKLYEELVKDDQSTSLVKFIMQYGDKNLVDAFFEKFSIKINHRMMYYVDLVLHDRVNPVLKLHLFERMYKKKLLKKFNIVYDNFPFVVPAINVQKINTIHPNLSNSVFGAIITVIKNYKISLVNFGYEINKIQANMNNDNKKYLDNPALCSDLIVFMFSQRNEAITHYAKEKANKLSNIWKEFGYDIDKIALIKNNKIPNVIMFPGAKEK